jgi:hypothetical protein
MTMKFAVFDAFWKAGTPEDEARKAAEALDLGDELHGIKVDVAIIKNELMLHRWMFGLSYSLLFALQAATLLAVLFKH